MYCCPNCFTDIFLQSQIKFLSNLRNNCAFCGSQNIEVIDAGDLFDRFAPLIDLYEIDNNGMNLGKIIQHDWQIFGRLRESAILNLLADISGILNLPKKRFKCRIERDENQLELWHDFREELKHQNRYFPKLGPKPQNLRKFLEFLILPIQDVPASFFRARIDNQHIPYNIEDMGKPPENKVSSGRANPIGIPYLYTASDVKTAISEVRPFINDSITVVHITAMEPLAIVDLRNPRKTISPFVLSEDELSAMYNDLPFLILLGNELSKPIARRSANLEYLPSQYLCEFVKHSNFDGIAYRSSLTGGDNFAIFEEGKLQFIKTSQHSIDSISINYSTIP